ncbi:MAG: TonB-dependent receptor [Burkholderiaceae bacterium]
MNTKLKDRRVLSRATALPAAALWAVLMSAASPAQAVSSDLIALDLEQLLQVKVIGASKYAQRQSEVGAAVSVITRAEIKSFGWRTLAQALASLPGIHTTYDRQYHYLGTRGFGLPGDFTTRVLVNINGNRINEPIYDVGPVGREIPLDLALVERIEFIPGPGGAVYGQNAMFGVVNVITRNGADLDGAELALAYQRPQALREGRVSWGKRFDDGTDLLLSASGMRARGEDRTFEFGRTGLAGVARGLDGERDKDFLLRATHGPWALDVVHGDHRKDDPTGAYLSDPLVPGQYEADRFTVAQLQYEHSFPDSSLHLSARLFAGNERYRAAFAYGTVSMTRGSSDWRGGELRLLASPWQGHKLMLGLEVQHNPRIDQDVMDPIQPANDVSVHRSGHRVGLYVQDEWRASATFTTTLGLRVDHNNVTGRQFSPRAALIWQAMPSTTLKALYGRAHRAPNAYESEYGDGLSLVANPTLGGETIDTLEWVIDHRIGHQIALRSSLYQWSMHDLIVLGIDGLSGLPQYQSGGKVRARGIEVSADKTWATGARLRGSVSYQQATHADGSAQINAPKLLAKLNASAPLPLAGVRAGYELRAEGKRRSLDGTELGGHAISNLQLTTESLARGTELSLKVENLFNKRYAQPAADTNWQNALEQDGRVWRLGLGLRF